MLMVCTGLSMNAPSSALFHILLCPRSQLKTSLQRWDRSEGVVKKRREDQPRHQLDNEQTN